MIFTLPLDFYFFEAPRAAAAGPGRLLIAQIFPRTQLFLFYHIKFTESPLLPFSRFYLS